MSCSAAPRVLRPRLQLALLSAERRRRRANPTPLSAAGAAGKRPSIALENARLYEFDT